VSPPDVRTLALALLVALTLPLAGVPRPVRAGQHDVVPLRVPSGGRIRAVVGAQSATVNVERLTVPIRFMRQDGARLEPIIGELRHGERFLIEAEFPVAPAESEQPLTLQWSGGTATVLLLRTAQNRQVFRSEFLVLGAP
jgi:hypothetical protein